MPPKWENHRSIRHADASAADHADGADLNALYREEAPRLTKYFRFHARHRDDAGDLVQEAFLRFAGRIQHGLNGNPAAYLNRIARNLLFEQMRRYKTHGAKETPYDPSVEIAVPPTQSHEIEARQMMEAYQQAVDSLPPRTREVFLLHRVSDLSYKEIAGQLGITLGTVEWHMTEALLRLRRKMDDQ